MCCRRSEQSGRVLDEAFGDIALKLMAGLLGTLRQRNPPSPSPPT